MLRAPVFIDSVNLHDLRDLISKGVRRSECVVLIATKSVLSRHWCVLELYEAWRHRIPIHVVQVVGKGFSYEVAQQFVANFEEGMRAENSEGLDFLFKRFGRDLSELKSALHSILEENQDHGLIFNANQRDEELLANVKDIIEAVGRGRSFRIRWNSVQSANKLRRGNSSRLQHRWDGVLSAVQGAAVQPLVGRRPTVFICCAPNPSDTSTANVMADALCRRLNRGCVISGPSSIDRLKRCEVAVVLLSRPILFDPWALFEMYTALQLKKPLVTVVVAGAPFNFQDVAKILGNLHNELNANNPEAAQLLEERLPEGISIDQVGEVMRDAFSSLIAITWDVNRVVTTWMQSYNRLSHASQPEHQSFRRVRGRRDLPRSYVHRGLMSCLIDCWTPKRKLSLPVLLAVLAQSHWKQQVSIFLLESIYDMSVIIVASWDCRITYAITQPPQP